MSEFITTLADGKIRDFIDQTVRDDTPEESVRQAIEHRLVLELGYLPEQIEVDFTIQVGENKATLDLVVFPEAEQHSQDKIWIIIDCKSDSELTLSLPNGVEKLKSYLVACPNSEWGMRTDSKTKTVFQRILTGKEVEYREHNDLPSRTRENCLTCDSPVKSEALLLEVIDWTFDPEAIPIWELVAQISAEVPDSEWKKLPTDLAKRFDYYQQQRLERDR